LCNKNSCADVNISITMRIQALRDVFIQILLQYIVSNVHFPIRSNVAMYPARNISFLNLEL